MNEDDDIIIPHDWRGTRAEYMQALYQGRLSSITRALKSQNPSPTDQPPLRKDHT